MIKLPLNGKWTQPNISDKFGSVAYSKNINFDKNGFASLSPRMVNLFDDSGSVSNVSSAAFNIPVAYARTSPGTMLVATTEEPFTLVVSPQAKTIAEDSSSNNPNLAFTSHGVWFANKFHMATDTAVYSNNAGTWTANVITGLTSGVRHCMAHFRNKNSLAVANGNTVKLYNTSYSNTVTLTLPADFEVIGLAYNNYTLGIVTRLGNDTAGQNSNAYFFVWNGADTESGTGVDIGSWSAPAVVPYKSSFALVSTSGQLLYWNGGGFDELAHFPFYVDQQTWGDLLSPLSYGNNLVVDGDVMYLNLSFSFYRFGNKDEQSTANNQSGVWCFDPEVGLYHRWSLSNSKSYVHSITQANVNTSTDVLTTSATIPATGNPVVLTSGLGGLTKGEVYYVIKLSATTFQIANTKEEARAGAYLDITSAASTSYLWMYDVIDYGAGYALASGAVGLWGLDTRAYKDIIAGGRVLNTALSSQPTLCTAVPQLENRGYVVTPKIFVDSLEENITGVYIKHARLDKNDGIIVKIKTKDYLGIPISSPNGGTIPQIVWTGTKDGYTSADLSEVKEAFDDDEEIEVEFTAGAGAGQMVKLAGIEESSGTYTLTMSEDVIGATTGLNSYFIMDNWKEFGSINATTQKNGHFYVPIAESSKSPQLKIELRGYQTTIEDVFIINKTQLKAE